jgi:hypothetical protein
MNFKPADEEQRVIAELKGKLAAAENENKEIKTEFLNMSEDHARLIKAVAERDALLKEKDGALRVLCDTDAWMRDWESVRKELSKTPPSEALDRALAAEREKCEAGRINQSGAEFTYDTVVSVLLWGKKGA